MTETQSYIIEVINLVPHNSICFIQAPDIEDSSALNNLLMTSEFGYYKQVTLSPANKEKISEIIKDEEVEGYFQSIEIRYNGKLYFEGYDGMEYGTISKDLNVPENFIKGYINGGMCIVSNEW